jgi:hypothetical protein
MIDTLAVALRSPELVSCRDPAVLRRILKRVWGGHVLWTPAAERELLFWEACSFEGLSSPMSFDALQGDIEDFFLTPRPTTLADDVRILAADTSDSASGGGEFVALNGELHQVSRMFSPLSTFGVEQSSTYRELEGIAKLLLALEPGSSRRVVVVCDNQSTVAILRRGSRIPALQAVAAGVFASCLHLGVCVFPLWQRRDTKIVAACDDDSRILDECAFWLPPTLFWRANGVARSLWGMGFQFDRMSAMSVTQPMDIRFKLPYNSRWRDPCTSGWDALRQQWTGFVNFCNPPFCLLGRVLVLIERQQGVAAVVVPLETRQPWSHKVLPDARGVVARVLYRPGKPGLAMQGPGGEKSAAYNGEYAIVFFDFRPRGVDRSGFRTAVTAEELLLRARLLPDAGHHSFVMEDGSVRTVASVLVR